MLLTAQTLGLARSASAAKNAAIKREYVKSSRRDGAPECLIRAIQPSVSVTSGSQDGEYRWHDRLKSMIAACSATTIFQPVKRKSAHARSKVLSILLADGWPRYTHSCPLRSNQSFNASRRFQPPTRFKLHLAPGSRSIHPGVFRKGAVSRISDKRLLPVEHFHRSRAENSVCRVKLPLACRAESRTHQRWVRSPNPLRAGMHLELSQWLGGSQWRTQRPLLR